MNATATNRDLVLAAWSCWGEGGSDALLARYDQFFSEDFEWHPAMIAAIEGERTYVGREAFAEYWREFTSVFGGVTLGRADVDDISARRVLITAPIEVEGAASGLEIGAEIAYVFDFDDGRITRGWSFMSPAEARKFAS